MEPEPPATPGKCCTTSSPKYFLIVIKWTLSDTPSSRASRCHAAALPPSTYRAHILENASSVPTNTHPGSSPAPAPSRLLPVDTREGRNPAGLVGLVSGLILKVSPVGPVSAISPPPPPPASPPLPGAAPVLSVIFSPGHTSS